jgi:hypothetical protein
LSTVNMGSLVDLADVATMSLYGFEDYHGLDIGVVRAARLWFAPLGGELALEIKLQPGDMRLGFAISRTEEVTNSLINLSFRTRYTSQQIYNISAGDFVAELTLNLVST